MPLPGADSRGEIDGALRSTLFATDLRVELLDGFDESFDELFESVAADVPCVPEKDAAFLRWRYGRGSPIGAVTILGTRDGETLLGYAVLGVSVDGNNGYLLDLTTRSGRHEVARSLLGEATRHFAQSGVKSITYPFLESSTSPRAKDTWRLGFFPRSKESRHPLLVKFADQNVHKLASDYTNWSYSIGDGEASFWHRGRVS
jgi:hypothetical protein